jgi:thiosulfate/3-mercaptopyruvate sulfurtransferase
MVDVSGRHIVSTEWLAAHLDAPDLVVLDGSWHLPAEKRDARAEFDAGHIPGARFFDIDAISDRAVPLPHMLPSPALFKASVEALGIGDGDGVVVYDASAPGLMSGARAWWMLRAFGHGNVAVLDGGLRKWKAEGRAVGAGDAAPRPGRKFTPRPRAELVRSLGDMRNIVAGGHCQIADARSAGRFQGRDPEPRPGLRSGHMPGARSVPFTTLLAADGTLKPKDELLQAFTAAGIDPTRPVVTSCGSGVTAAVLSLALAILGQPDHGLYDGSWSEWGQSSLDTEVATGP